MRNKFRRLVGDSISLLNEYGDTSLQLSDASTPSPNRRASDISITNSDENSSCNSEEMNNRRLSSPCSHLGKWTPTMADTKPKSSLSRNLFMPDLS
ncbi:hypothetical protein H4219_001670 [Mycoemilia scoparia]|uniref:Uncharacterized protein n=1 Tax=Mycoemilia scoparia TaxID=417184 RepID=A0A9W7ZZJ8_9FUNG|nr:hypothetical protein H4219_001670 [Mycoemilia scoparia]